MDKTLAASVVAGFAVGIAVVALFVAESNSIEGSFTQNSNKSPTTVNVTMQACTDCGGYSFQPDVVRVTIGVNNTVRWINHTNATNGVWADNLGDDASFYAFTHLNLFGMANVGVNPTHILPKESVTYTFAQPGIVQYHGFSSQIGSGAVVVLPTPPSSSNTNNSSAEITPSYYFYHTLDKVPNEQIVHGSYQGILAGNGTAIIHGQKFYVERLNATNDISGLATVQFRGVQFAFPSGRGITPGGEIISLRVHFQDGSEEVFGKQVTFEDGSGEYFGIGLGVGPIAEKIDNAVTVLTAHANPKAGFTIIPGEEFNVLVSEN